MTPAHLVGLAAAVAAVSAGVAVATLDRRRADVASTLVMLVAAGLYAGLLIPVGEAWGAGDAVSTAAPIVLAALSVASVAFLGSKKLTSIPLAVAGLVVAGGLGAAFATPYSRYAVAGAAGVAVAAGIFALARGRSRHPTFVAASRLQAAGQLVAWLGVAVVVVVFDVGQMVTIVGPVLAGLASAFAVLRYGLSRSVGQLVRPTIVLAVTAALVVVVVGVATPTVAFAGPTSIAAATTAVALVGVGLSLGNDREPATDRFDDIRLPTKTRHTLMAIERLADPTAVEERVVEALTQLVPGARLEVLRSESAPQGALSGARPVSDALTRHAVERGFLAAHQRNELPAELRKQLAAAGGDVLVPVKSGKVVFGMLRLDHPAPSVGLVEQTRRFADLLAFKLDNHRLYAEMETSRRLASLGSMASALAHDLRTPLSAIGMNLQMLQARAGDLGADAECIEIGLAEVARLNQHVAGLLDFARPVALSGGELDYANIAAEVAHQCAAVLDQANVRLVTRIEAEQTRGTGDAPRIIRAVVNLVVNAIGASQAGAEVRLIVEQRGPAMVVSVEDDGVGIAPEDQRKMFDPFFTTRADGTGLGLAITRKIVRAHGGELEVRSRLGIGTRMTMILPRVGQSA